MSTTNGVAVEIPLECGHSRWFKPPLPNLGEVLYCPACTTERETSVSVSGIGTAYETEDNWESKRLRRGYQGTCLEDGCKYSQKNGNWFRLRDTMHTHHMRVHTRFGAALNIREIDLPLQPEF